MSEHYATVVEGGFKLSAGDVRRDGSGRVDSVSEAHLMKWRKSAEFLFDSCRIKNKQLTEAKNELEKVEKLLIERSRFVNYSRIAVNYTIY